MLDSNSSNRPVKRDAGAPAYPDSRMAAFADLVDAFDRRDWRDGQLATRRLRQLGYSVCLVKPQGGSGAA